MIPFNRPTAAGDEWRYMKEALRSGHISSNGKFTQKCQKLIQRSTGAGKVLLTTSCTDALELAALLLDIRAGDEVILPSFTFVSTANAFALRGAKLVFADIRPDTLNLDEKALAARITEKTKAVVVVHYAGVACEMSSIERALAGTRAQLVEDNAHGYLGTYQGRPLGSFGALSCLSFHETKNLTCGEGGALLVNRPEYMDRADVIHQKGTNRARFLQGMEDRYTWQDLGSSFAPSDLLAAFLYAQLKKAGIIKAKRRGLWNFYHDGLTDWAGQNRVQMPATPDGCVSAFHMFYLVMPSRRDRDELIRYLKTKGVHAVFHYVPLHLSPFGKRYGGKPGDLPVTESVSERQVRLPFFTNMSPQERQRVLDAVRSYRCLGQTGDR